MWKTYLLTCTALVFAALPARAQVVALQAHNGQFVALDPFYAKFGLKADSDRIINAATYKIIRFGFGKAALQAINKRIVTIDRASSDLAATAYGVGPWETFKVFELGNNLVALQAYNGRFVSPYGKDLELKAYGGVIGPFETFRLVELGPPESPCYHAWYHCTNFTAPFPILPPGIGRIPPPRPVLIKVEVDPNVKPLESPGLPELLPGKDFAEPVSATGPIVEKLQYDPIEMVNYIHRFRIVDGLEVFIGRVRAAEPAQNGVNGKEPPADLPK